jgi:hypothetical protein
MISVTALIHSLIGGPKHCRSHLLQRQNTIRPPKPVGKIQAAFDAASKTPKVAPAERIAQLSQSRPFERPTTRRSIHVTLGFSFRDILRAGPSPGKQRYQKCSSHLKMTWVQGLNASRIFKHSRSGECVQVRLRAIHSPCTSIFCVQSNSLMAILLLAVDQHDVPEHRRTAQGATRGDDANRSGK